MSASARVYVDPVLERADHAAAAALDELPEALILVFDRELRFVLTAGQALDRLGNPPSCVEGQLVQGAFPVELWDAVEPLFRSALDGETRSRESLDRRAASLPDGRRRPAAPERIRRRGG